MFYITFRCSLPIKSILKKNPDEFYNLTFLKENALPFMRTWHLEDVINIMIAQETSATLSDFVIFFIRCLEGQEFSCI